MKCFKLMLIFCSLLILSTACSQSSPQKDNPETLGKESDTTIEGNVDSSLEHSDDVNPDSDSQENEDGSSTSSETSSIDYSHSSVDELIDQMSLEEKIAQLFVVDFYTMTGNYTDTELSDTIENFLNTYPVGGIIYFGDNISDASQLETLNTSLQSLSSIPLLIGVDEEGGTVSRLGSKSIVDHLDTAASLAENYSSDEVKTMASSLGQELLDLGFNLDFAPILDVNTNPDNPVIGDRSFSSDPETVAEYALAFSEGLNSSGVISSGKHFPGHGDTSTDSHLGVASTDKDLDSLESVEWVPFKAAIADQIPMIMVGHITTPNVTDDGLPATLSSAMISEYLRGSLGYDGVVITDSLRMGAITDYYDDADIALDTILAGNDLLLLPNDFEAAYNKLLDAVQSGDLSQERLDESLERILTMKKNFIK